MEDRLIKIEEQLLFVSRQVDELDQVVQQLGNQMTSLKREVDDLRKLREAMSEDSDLPDSDPSHT